MQNHLGCANTPEDYELKEGGYWEEAKLLLMKGKEYNPELEGAVKSQVDLEPCKKSVDALGGYVNTKEMLFNILIP